MDFYSIFRSRRLITDGAMGTYYSEKYGMETSAPEIANLADPQKIREIHREYIRAGADVLRTNSFSSNAQTLCRGTDSRLSEEEQLKAVYENVLASCRIAQNAAEEERKEAAENGRKPREIYIAGDIGPVPEQGGSGEASEFIAEEYRAMAKAHLDAGMELIWFETFSDFEQILPAAEWIKSVSDVFIMASFSVNMYGYTKTGIGMRELIKTAKENSLIDGIGFNCGIGPSHLSRLLKRQDL